MQLTLMGSRVAIRLLPQSEQTKNGIVVPATVASETVVRGEVIGVGYDIPMSSPIKPGVHVLIGRWATTTVNIDGDEILIAPIADIIAITD